MTKKKDHTVADSEKALNSLLGVVEGITIDSLINQAEIQFLVNWMNEHRINEEQQPYKELIPLVAEVVSDGVITKEELLRIKRVCNMLAAHNYFSEQTADIQRLHTLLAGVAADQVISVEELTGVAQWLIDHSHLQNTYPYDEVLTKITTVLKHKVIDQHEHNELIKLFGEFVSMYDDKTITNPTVNENSLCETNPQINFNGLFCFTGKSSRYSRTDFKKLITELGGKVTDDITTRLNYLVIGDKGQPQWKFGSYGGKIDEAIKLKKNGHPILIIHEKDLHAAVDAR
jgi:NAD-dependent DNA ligase